jgi:hypothetical protein
VSNGRELVSDLRAIREDWHERVRVRRDAATWRLVELLIRRPVINASFVASELGIAMQNVYRTVEPLVTAQVLVSTGQQRDRVWRAPEVLDAVDAFALRAGRRRRGA